MGAIRDRAAEAKAAADQIKDQETQERRARHRQTALDWVAHLTGFKFGSIVSVRLSTAGEKDGKWGDQAVVKVADGEEVFYFAVRYMNGSTVWLEFVDMNGFKVKHPDGVRTFGHHHFSNLAELHVILEEYDLFLATRVHA